MPSQNAVKIYIKDGIYHVYNRGVEKRSIFDDNDDYWRFIKYFEAYLGSLPVLDESGRLYPKLTEHVDLIAYCLMPNHFHLMIRQKTERGLVEFMRRIMTGYTMYFNLKYSRVGPLLQGTYKAAHIDEDSYATHVSRYIHLNPDDSNYQRCLNYTFSSLQYYGSGNFPSWLSPNIIFDNFSNLEAYHKFCSDFCDSQKMILQLASSLELPEIAIRQFA